ncbi:MAG: DUF1566 domain-containing protein, partial [Deltaproteobacteria bacterium]|nr:DUF1566 domain-containing protein [Deltaproteobacteria bacterium]
TGLMWEKRGSLSAIFWHRAKRYVSRLNKENFSGHDDWRIPTTEELASLLERVVNKKGLHTGPFFDGKQKACWTSDSEMTVYGFQNCVIDFSDGSIYKVHARHDYNITFQGQSFIRAVRTMKPGEPKTK